MIMRCKMAGKLVEDENGLLALCHCCSGEIIIENNKVKLSTKAKGFYSLPRKPSFDFNCPATLANPLESDLLEE